MKSELVESQIDVTSRPNDSAANSMLAEVNASQDSYTAVRPDRTSSSHLPDLSLFDSEQAGQDSSKGANNSDVVLASGLSFTWNGQPVVLSNGGLPIVVPRK